MNMIKAVYELRTNSKSVASLTLGILSIMIPIIGLILGIIGIVLSKIAKKEIAEMNEGGNVLATAGFVCSLVGTIIHSLWLLLAILSFSLFTNMEVSYLF